MLFTKESIEKIVKNQKSQTRRLFHEGDYLDKNKLVRNKKGNLRWSRENAIQSKRGAKGVYYCSKCLKCHPELDMTIYKGFIHDDCGGELIPLRIHITKIEKQKLLNITEGDVKKEGFERKIDFLRYFCGLAKIKLHVQHPQTPIGKEFWTNKLHCSIEKNPFVWVLNFSVLK